MLRRLFWLIIILLLLAVLALIGYSYSGLMTPEAREISEPVSLDGD